MMGDVLYWEFLAVYGAASVIYVKWVFNEGTNVRNWHAVMAFTVLLPVTLLIALYTAAAYLLSSLRDWLMRQA